MDTAVTRLRQRQPLLGRIIGYHLGLNDAAGSQEPGDSGGIAAALCLTALAAQGAGA